eukprot:TRINITY_DN56809_c0_g1_i1.p1 TRINITY_DN56809_c0_g1~~TRINITY_DN56809_c0_g1_i1.p1  ORF type:complete len:132 (-),score=18.57 TRINITY_DN56809_c0_g1_i1:58-453(-)
MLLHIRFDLISPLRANKGSGDQLNSALKKDKSPRGSTRFRVRFCEEVIVMREGAQFFEPLRNAEESLMLGVLLVVNHRKKRKSHRRRRHGGISKLPGFEVEEYTIRCLNLFETKFDAFCENFDQLRRHNFG